MRTRSRWLSRLVSGRAERDRSEQSGQGGGDSTDVILKAAGEQESLRNRTTGHKNRNG